MIPPLKVKCKIKQYLVNGKCMLFPAKFDPTLIMCIKQNCIYFDGERK